MNGRKRTRHHGSYKRSGELQTNEGNRVSLPGDVDYVFKGYLNGISIKYR